MSEKPSRWDAPSSSSAPAAVADTKPTDAATAAAAIAAKIAASLRGAGVAASSALALREKEEGDFVRDIEINDLRNRYVLTKGPTQKQVSSDLGYLDEGEGWLEIGYEMDGRELSCLYTADSKIV